MNTQNCDVSSSLHGADGATIRNLAHNSTQLPGAACPAVNRPRGRDRGDAIACTTSLRGARRPVTLRTIAPT
eukprot:3305321-Pyramimonas_sp.AAC.1